MREGSGDAQRDARDAKCEAARPVTGGLHRNEIRESTFVLDACVLRALRPRALGALRRGDINSCDSHTFCITLNSKNRGMRGIGNAVRAPYFMDMVWGCGRAGRWAAGPCGYAVCVCLDRYAAECCGCNTGTYCAESSRTSTTPDLEPLQVPPMRHGHAAVQPPLALPPALAPKCSAKPLVRPGKILLSCFSER